MEHMLSIRATFNDQNHANANVDFQQLANSVSNIADDDVQHSQSVKAMARKLDKLSCHMEYLE